MSKSGLMLATITTLVLILLAGAAFAQRIVVQADQFTSTTYLTAQEIADIKATHNLHGFGVAEYTFTVPQAGWYELYVQAAPVTTDLFLDNEFLINTTFESGVWPQKEGAEKTLNLDLTAGEHTLRLDRAWPFGLPWMARFFLDPSTTVAGMVRLAPLKDYLDFRLGERFPVELKAGRLPQAYTLTLTMTNVESGEVVHTLPEQIPAGQGTYTQTLDIPTDLEGVFDLKATDAQGNAVDRITQYLVVDTHHRPTPGTEVTKELVATIDPSKQAPDYVSAGGVRMVHAAFGDYLESGPKGRTEDQDNADWFAYILHLPSKEELYEAEIQYPDDDLRTYNIILAETAANPYPPTLGVRSGGEFTLSNQMQTQEFYFYPRQNDPRLLFYNWFRGQRAAAGIIRVYRVTGNLPVLAPPQPGQREYGFYQEEPLRFTTNFGGEPVGNTWANINRSADRLCQWANYLGANLWHPTIAVYQSDLWPSHLLPGWAPADTDGYGVIGPYSDKEQFRKDVVRLMLLNCEKYGLGFVGELHMDVNGVLGRHLDTLFGGTGTTDDDSPAKPWLSVDRTGQFNSLHYNALYPGVEDWVASVIQELATRYSDSPAFQGVSLRFMGWQFSGWQTLSSINWGYEDWTLAQFQKDTGIQVPVANDDPQRFSKRYDWLMANAYKPWVDWRCQRIFAYHQRLAAILTKARPDLKLHLDLYGPTYDLKYASNISPQDWEQKGWTGLIRESGIDPALYRQDPTIVLNEDRAYPSAGGTMDPFVVAQAREEDHSAVPLEGVSKPAGDGTVSFLHFDANSYEGEVMPGEWLGLGKQMLNGRDKVAPAGVINPAGVHFLARFAAALADANVIYIHDGSHGYSQQQPQYLRDWLAQYRALPPIGMTRLPGGGDPVALWSGKQGGRTVFYVVNRAPYPVAITVHFAAQPDLRRLAPAQTVPVTGPAWSLSLEPYQLLALSSNLPPQDLTATVPADVKSLLDKQIAFTEELLRGEGAAAGIALIPYSPMDQRAAEAQLAVAKADLAAGRYVTARLDLMQYHLIKVYEAFGAYPPDLLYRKAPAPPDQALSPAALLAQSMAPAAAAAAVIPASQISPALAGEEVLAWSGQPLDLHVQEPTANRFRVSLGYATAAPYARPTVLLDGQLLPGQNATAIQENAVWGKFTPLPPFTMRPGEHRLDFQPRPGSRVGLFYFSLDPVYRVLPPSDWMVIGPFPGISDPPQIATGMAPVYPPETERDFSSTYPGADGKPVAWIHPPGTGDYVNLHQITGAYNWRVSYAVTYITSPEDRAAELKFGMDYWARIWVNGHQVWEQLTPHGGPARGQYTVPLQLHQGVNELLIKLHAGSSGNGFWAAISDPGDLTVAAQEGQ